MVITSDNFVSGSEIVNQCCVVHSKVSLLLVIHIEGEYVINYNI